MKTWSFHCGCLCHWHGHSLRVRQVRPAEQVGHASQRWLNNLEMVDSPFSFVFSSVCQNLLLVALNLDNFKKILNASRACLHTASVTSLKKQCDYSVLSVEFKKMRKPAVEFLCQWYSNIQQYSTYITAYHKNLNSQHDLSTPGTLQQVG